MASWPGPSHGWAVPHQKVGRQFTSSATATPSPTARSTACCRAAAELALARGSVPT